MSETIDQHLKTLGPQAFKLWIHLLKQRDVGEDTLTVAMADLARKSGVVNDDGGDGLGPVHAAMRQLVKSKYITLVPEAQRRCRITLLKVVDIR